MAGVRGVDKLTKVQSDDPILARIRYLLIEEKKSASEIGKDIGKSRNSVIGLIQRHIKGAREAPERKTDRPLQVRGAAAQMFAEPSAPRRFSWEEGASA